MLLRAAPLPRGAIPAPGSDAWDSFMESVVREGFAHVRCGKNAATKLRRSQGIALRTGSYDAPHKDENTRLQSARWHARDSVHHMEQLEYSDFEQGLLKDHSLHEQQYIKSLKHAACVETLVPDIAAIWHLQYALPFLTADRDFVELVVTLPLPPSEAAFSTEHEETTVEARPWAPGAEATEATEAAPTAHHVPSFMVVSIPVEMEASVGYLRAYYTSVEGVLKAPRLPGAQDRGVAWR
ncbi:hypothetical protein MVES1_002452 [Malassezia vespertilionis]|uniref:DUF3074 domain-containing protein n=1 Tax=Malassezia vespertilionis TaxID=2020962 RepID=A0A2N1JB20_9BASI|nr:uncharacterized protein MVES1_002452 [Malassezia vespertilionis]PKI83692.1 hypothetical protein MVES_002317 [Malassezia vespertilionis]WFD07096.1 hypothetical protein MVES1_002452 [Malassezia vespertilionis]